MTTLRMYTLILVAALAGGAPAVFGAGNDATRGHEAHTKETSDHETDGERANGEGHNEIHLTEAQRRRLALRTAPAERGSAEAIVSLPATLTFDADRIAKIGPRLRAKVIEVVKDLGEPVSAGEPVVVMDSVALGKAKARYLTARARLETEKANYDREQALAAQKISSQAALLEARARYREAQAALESTIEELRLYGLSRETVGAIETGGEAPLSRYVLTSPIDGVVQERNLTPGQTVGPETTPIHVVNTTRLWVMIEAYERNIPMLAEDQTMHLTVRALPGRRFEGRIDWVSRALDPESRTLRARAVVDNPDSMLRAGMFGTANVHVDTEGPAALVPVDAVQTIGDRPAVFVPGHEPNVFRAVPVVLGEEAGGMVEIASGIRPGDEVVISGAFDLKSVMTAGGRSADHSH